VAEGNNREDLHVASRYCGRYMSSPSHSEGARNAIRTNVDAVKQAIDRLPSHTGVDDDALAHLHSVWNNLVECLALGPAPLLRACPNCGQMIMEAATLCGYCWKRPGPLAG